MIAAILQARVSSSRLPGKVLKPILGKPMLLLQVERVNRARRIERLVVATSTDRSDDAVETLCRSNGIACSRGSLADVLDRYYQAAKPLGAEHIVRLTGDCPLADPAVIDAVIAFHIEGGYDYTSNTLEPTWPDGLDVEVVRFSCLEAAWKEATLPSQREHVLPFIHQQPARFRLGSYRSAQDLSQYRWTVDEPEDFELVKAIYEELYPTNPAFTTQDALDLLKRRPGLADLNKRFIRNEGYLTSLSRDRTFPGGKG